MMWDSSEVEAEAQAWSAMTAAVERYVLLSVRQGRMRPSVEAWLDSVIGDVAHVAFDALQDCGAVHPDAYWSTTFGMQAQGA